jgi:hypothetical protein
MNNFYYPHLLPQTNEELSRLYGANESMDSLWEVNMRENRGKEIQVGDKAYLKGAIDVTKLKVNTEPQLLKTIFVGESNKYDRNLAMAANDPMGQRTREENRIVNGANKSGIEDYLSSRDPFGLLIIVVIPIIIAIILFKGRNNAQNP